MVSEGRFFARRAWVQGTDGGAWKDDVLMTVGADGYWASVEDGVSVDRLAGARLLDGPVLPGIANAHSHAFQRAIVGLTERSGGQADDFWSWRARMYRAALRISPAQVEAIATQLYAELLAGGYTQVCEFHYLHNNTDGRAYADPAELSLALVRAAQATGIGLTLLPTLYMRSGFGASGLRDDQRRFASTPDSVLRIAEAVDALGLPNIKAGVALHSLRAVDAGAMLEVQAAAQSRGWPVHIHIAEQVREVEDCLAHHGQRPIEWLLDHAPVDARWNLVHATHTVAEELAGLAEARASIVICPTTEANLGDGVFDLPGWMGRGGLWSIGSDSHVCRSASEELRLLEYSQRLALRQRNVAARAAGADSTAAVLLEGAVRGASAAAGLRLGGIQPGHRADFLMLDAEAPAWAGVPATHALDAWIFSAPAPTVLATWVAGRAVPDQRRRQRSVFGAAMREFWGP